MRARWIEIGVSLIRKAETKLEREDCSSGSVKFRLSFTFFEYRKLEEREKKGSRKRFGGEKNKRFGFLFLR